MSDPTIPGSPLDQIIADYLQAAEAGKVPSRQALLDAHPEYAADLRAFFADYDRLDNRADALRLTVAVRPPAERPKVRYFGDYELLEEIAEGGMGLVYKARQETLGRVVALKLVRAGRLARPIDLARFRIEAEAAAGLDHPNIVPLYEVGEHEGQQYLAMKFIDGPSLAKLPRGSIKAEVERLEAVARAVDFAHRQGILHRDIKPSNILTDSAGTAYVTDFGLAKRIDAELSLTESGQLLGTAGYIAPEQALGKKGLTVTADVFSLGAVLFERLTSTPAFPGGTILERLRSLHESITPRPTVLMPTMPRDLETVVLKCLEREPAKRYTTAAAVADDLSRWLRGEPIVARRVTTAERFWLWCRRNPAVAGWVATTCVLLLTGTVVSSYFAVQATRRADEAVQAQDEAVKAQRRAEWNQLAGILRPIGYTKTSYDPIEQYALYELAELPEDRLKLLFLDVALADSDSALRVARRSQLVAQSVVGASNLRREMALKTLSSRLADASADPRTRLAACWLALELGSTDVSAVRDSLRWVIDTDSFVELVSVTSLSDEQIRRLHPICLAALTAMPHTAFIDWLVEITVRLDRPVVAQTVDQLIQILEKVQDGQAQVAAVRGLETLAPRLDSSAAFRTWSRLAAGDRMPHLRNTSIEEGLEALAGRLDGPAAVRVSHALVGVSGKPLAVGWESTARRLMAMAPNLDSVTAARAWDRLLEGLGETKNL